MKVDFPTTIKRNVESVVSILGSLAFAIDEASDEIASLEAAKADYCNSLRVMIDQRLTECERNLALVESFIKIAQAHAAADELRKSNTPSPFSKISLIKTQALIDNRSGCDAMAAKLYYDATGQRLYLKNQANALTASLDVGRGGEMSVLEHKLSSRKAEHQKLVDSYLETLHLPIFENILKRSYELLKGSDLEYGEDGACLGLAKLSLPLPLSIDLELRRSLKDENGLEFDDGGYFLRLPIFAYGLTGGSLQVRSVDAPDESLYDGLQRYVLDVIALAVKQIERVDFIDPVNLNSSHFEEIAKLTSGGNPLVRPVPHSSGEVKARLATLDAALTKLEKRFLDGGGSKGLRYVLVLDQFPLAYDASSLSIIRRFCLNAERYGLLIVMCGKAPSRTNFGDEEILSDIKRHSLCVEEREGAYFFSNRENEQLKLRYAPLPLRDALPQVLRDIVFERSEKPAADNSYVAYMENRGKELRPEKGNRELRNLPLGLNEAGSIVYVSLEDDRYATFICGASRSGKSTLLHSLLTSVFLSKHPDDVEVWLVDFKMTEFSRYLDKTPPHIQYIVLDESPELVYDLIDRLVDYACWRQKKFKKYQWDKIEDAKRSGMYMPMVLVVIDEFSIMSKIIADSAMSSKDYRDKMQFLLVKGAALGFRFIFASQGFTKGTRGLSSLSKDQIQQRIAMKTSYEEIKETLDLPEMSAEDKMEIEELDGHYALLKMPYGFDGGASRLQKAHVLYFSSRSEQLSIFSKAFDRYVPSETYDMNSYCSFRRRLPVVIDGNERKDFSSALSLVEERQKKWKSFDETTILMCIGEPRRMESYCPIELVSNHKENVLLFSSVSDGESVQSIMSCAVKSLSYQQVSMHLCMGKRNRYMNDIADDLPFTGVHRGIDDLCVYIENLKQKVENGERGKELIILFDIEDLFGDMDSVSDYRAHSNRSRRGPDINTVLAFNLHGNTFPAELEANDCCDDNIFDADAPRVYDAQEDVLFLLTHGSKLGYHVVVVVEDSQAMKATGIKGDFFRHKVFFGSQRESAKDFVCRADINALAEADPFCFRYSSGTGGVTFRPYGHNDLGIFSSDAVDDDDFYYPI